MRRYTRRCFSGVTLTHGYSEGSVCGRGEMRARLTEEDSAQRLRETRTSLM